MARQFVDTSALVKLYRNEPRTAEVQQCIGTNDVLVLSGIAFLEFQSAFFGLVRQRLVSQGHAQQRITLLKQDLPNFEMVPLVQSIVSAAEILVDRFGVNEGLRPADALQLACALEANSRFSVGCDPDYRCSVKPVRQGIRADRQTVVLITICSQPTAGPQFRWSFGRARNS